jgi:hypothetical protein
MPCSKQFQLTIDSVPPYDCLGVPSAVGSIQWSGSSAFPDTVINNIGPSFSFTGNVGGGATFSLCNPTMFDINLVFTITYTNGTPPILIDVTGDFTAINPPSPYIVNKTIPAQSIGAWNIAINNLNGIGADLTAGATISIA